MAAAANISWRNHIWALAVIANVISALLLLRMPAAMLMKAIPAIVSIAAAIIAVVIAIAIAIRRGRLHIGKDGLEKTLISVSFVIFTVTVLDRIILGAVTGVMVAKAAETQKGLDFFETMVYLLIRNAKTFFRGVINTIELALIGTLVGFILSLLLVFMRTEKPNKRDSEAVQAIKLLGNSISSFYVTIIRGTPMMVQALIIYYAGFNIVRGLFPNYSISQLNGIYSVFLASAVTVSLNTTAYITEILRGSIEAIDKGQTEASRSLGLTPWQTMMNVVFPQAVKNSIPAICNEFIINIKDTSVLNVVGMTELMFMTTTVAGTYYKYLETYMITAVIYLLLTICLQALMNAVAKKLDMPVQHGVPSSN